MFISPAYAQAAAGGGGSALMQFLPLLLIFVVFYFLLIRPQQKRAKEHKEMISKVRRGDTVVTAGGIVGKVTKVESGEEVIVEVADGVRVHVISATLSDVRSKNDPVEPAGNDN
ncbi:MAG: preprotein translocase subunit YajC [Alphaproteobacteria bacterium]